MRKRVHRRRNQSGQTLTEFALLCLFVLFPLLFGVINFAIVIYTYSEVAYSANAAARWASVHGSTYSCSTCTPTGPAAAGDITTYVKGMAAWVDTTNPPAVTSTWTASSCQGGVSNCPGSVVQVQVQYNYPLFVPGFKTVTLPLTAVTQMVISQ